MEAKEKIKDRILKQAARIWGYSDQELETSFDPIVGLILETLASELEKLSSELEHSQSRIVERILEIMTPDVLRGTKPAHGIMHAQPLESKYQLKLENQLYYKKSFPNIYNPVKPDLKNLYFGPTKEMNIYNVSTNYVAYGNTLYSIDKSFHKQKVHRSNSSITRGSVYLGINCEKFKGTLKDFSIYTTIKNLEFQEMYYHYLKKVKVAVLGNTLSIQDNDYLNNEIDIDLLVRGNYNEMNRIYQEVNEYYEQNFLTFVEPINVDESSFEIPQQLQQLLQDFDRSSYLNNILWIELKFPETIHDELLDSALFATNCFPVVNKEIHESLQSMDTYINYIPLQSEDSFLGLESITDTYKNQYHLKDFNAGNLSSGYASLRHQGVVRFDERNASELIQYLLELLKDEGAAFALLGGDFVDYNLKRLNQLIATIEQQTKEQEFIKVNFPYVVVKPKVEVNENSKETLIVKYWSCAGEKANDLKPQTRFVDKNSIFQPTEIYLMTSTVGGVDRLTTRERIYAYRKSLLTHNRIVTFADIKAYCFDHFKEAISKVEVKKGTKINNSINKGFERTIDIILYQQNEDIISINPSEWDYLINSLLTKLNKASSNIYPYQIFTKSYTDKTAKHEIYN